MSEDPLFDPWSTVDAPSTDDSAALAQPREGAGRRWRPSPKAGDMPRIRPAPTAGERLREVAVPRLEALGARLQVAFHRTLIDDRPGRSPPTIRFRLIPRPGPFDDVPAVPGSVLEIVGDEASFVTARLWLDPVAEEPAVERRVDAARLDEAWVDEIMFEFVEKALRRT